MPNLDRRSFLRATAATGAAVAVGRLAGSAAPVFAATGTVLPTAALTVRQRMGVNVHPNFNTSTSVYRAANADAVVARVASLGMTHIRGNLAAQAISDSWAAACRKYGVKWLFLVVNEDTSSPTTQTLTQTRTNVELIRDRYADICAGIEGLNEPNQNRGTGGTTAGWQDVTVAHQQAIWQTAKAAGSAIAGVPIVGPSLHEGQVTRDGGTTDYQKLKTAGILAYQDQAGLHTYPGAQQPDSQLDKRLGWIRAAYGAGYPVWVTETGYSNIPKKPTPDQVAVYQPRMILQYACERGLGLSQYALLDNYDPTHTAIGDNYGLFSVSQSSTTAAADPTGWLDKPAATASRQMLAQRLADPAGTANYTPAPVQLTVTTPTSDVRYWTTATKAQSDAGTATVWLCRNIAVGGTSVSVTVTDRAGARTIPVGPSMLPVDLR